MDTVTYAAAAGAVLRDRIAELWSWRGWYRTNRWADWSELRHEHTIELRALVRLARRARDLERAPRRTAGDGRPLRARLMSGTLSLSTPWARHEFLDFGERRAIKTRIPEGYTLLVTCRPDRSAFGVAVMEWGTAMSGNRIVRDRLYYRTGQPLRDGIDAAIGWIAARAQDAA